MPQKPVNCGGSLQRGLDPCVDVATRFPPDRVMPGSLSVGFHVVTDVAWVQAAHANTIRTKAASLRISSHPGFEFFDLSLHLLTVFDQIGDDAAVVIVVDLAGL